MKLKKKTIIITAACILAAALGIGGFLIYEQIRPSRQSDFPAPKQSTQLGMMKRGDVQEQVKDADVVVQGTVTRILDPVEKEVPGPVPEEYADLMGGGETRKMTYYGFEITIEDVIKGNPGSGPLQIIVTQHDINDIPSLNEGREMIFCLTEKADYGGYGPISNNDGFYYIARDEKVYPADPTDVMERVSGMELSALKEEMRGYVKE